MDNTFIPKGMELVKQAVIADNANDLPTALSLYKQGLQYFLTGMKYVTNERSKEAIRIKVGQYMTRAEELNVALEKRGKKGKQVVNAGGVGSTPMNGVKHENKEGSDEEEEVDPETAKLKAAISGAIIKEKPNVKWEDIAGLEQAKQLLKEAVILPVKFPQLFTGKRTPWKGILLYGPPGTGKSYLAKAVATEAGSTFLSVSSSDLVSKYQGESERLVKQLFELARKSQPSIIFIDEVDSLCSSRGEGENDSARRIKTEFLVQMQGVGKDQTGVLVLGATNTPWELDPAIRRRFEKRVYIPLPEENARRILFQLSIGPTPNSLTNDNIATLARQTDGYSGADISVMVKDALYQPVRIAQSATHFKKVKDPSGQQKYLLEACSPGDKNAMEMSLYDIATEQFKPNDVNYTHFQSALDNVKPSVGVEDLRRFEDWTQQYGQDG